jgi:hypothetical protein
LDGRSHAVLDQNDASKRAKDLQVALRLAPEIRYNDFGINRYFRLTAEELRNKIDHHSRRTRTLTAEESHWKSAGGLSFMLGAEVFSVPTVFVAALKGEMDWRAVYSLSLKSFHHGGPASLFVSLDRMTSTIVFRRQLGECFSGLERWLRIVFTNDYVGVMGLMVNFLMDDDDPCEGVPDAYVFHVANSGVAHMFQVLKSEARLSEKSLVGPKHCFDFFQSQLRRLIDQLRAAASQQGTREINTFFATDVSQIQWKDPAAASPLKGARTGDKESKDPPPKKPRATPVGSENGVTTRNKEKQQTRKPLKPPAAAAVEEAQGSGTVQPLCGYHLAYLLGAASNECTSGDRCNFSHDFDISAHTSKELAAVLKRTKMATQIRAAAAKALKNNTSVSLASST